MNKSKKKAVKIEYTRLLSQMNNEFKYFRTFEEKDLIFSDRVNDLTNNQTFQRYNQHQLSPDKIAEVEEDIQSDDELVLRTTTLILNDLDQFLYDFIEGREGLWF